MAWPAVDKPRTAAVRNGREGLGSCWEGVGCVAFPLMIITI